MTEVERNAYLLIASVTAALHNGVRHYSSHDGERGRFLSTPLSIVQAMQSRGVIIDERDRVERTTTEREYERMTGEQPQ